MTNLFRAFDPSSLGNISINWLSALIILLIIPITPYVIRTTNNISLKNIFVLINKEFISILTFKRSPGSTWFLLRFFWFIFLNNFIGLFPYIFTASSHISFTLGLALPIWTGHVLYSWFKQPNFMFAHLVPKGTPIPLIRFIVLIELVRSIIRPLTLRIRLIANLTAGHLLLCLLSSRISVSILSPTAILVLRRLVVLVVLEIAVSLIQAYVFTLLTTLYLEEVQTKTIIIKW